jgi:hypothetical protein
MEHIPWNSIQEVQELKYRKNRVLFIDYLVRTRDGNSYVLHRTLKNIQQLGALVQQKAETALQN